MNSTLEYFCSSMYALVDFLQSLVRVYKGISNNCENLIILKHIVFFNMLVRIKLSRVKKTRKGVTEVWDEHVGEILI